MRNSRSINQDQEGLVAIIVTMIFMVIISLIVIGFSQQSRREARQALDRQLSSQASYAAESGINDARKEIEAGYTGSKNSCANDTIFTAARADLGNNTAYTCLLISQAVPTVVFGNVSTDKSTVFAVQAEAGLPIGTINLEWENASGGTASVTTYPDFVKQNTWPANAPGLLRTDIIPGDDASLSTRDNIINNAFTAFLYPSATTGLSAFDSALGKTSASAGAIVETTCILGVCKMDITGLSSTVYYLRLKSVYASNKVTVSIKGTGGAALKIVGTQAEIDVTGRAADVLKRVKVRVPLTTKDYLFPDYALEAGSDICKKLSASPVVGKTKNDCP